jgi:UDP-N-acetyl-D-mannosaminuronic acid transferase (WecB/TagA/CpsF family)
MSTLPLLYEALSGEWNFQSYMDASKATSRSYPLFGVRVDDVSPEHALLALWESCIARSGLRAVLVDLWTLLLAQRDYSVWEALSAADYVLPVSDDALLGRLLRQRGAPAVQPDALLFDLFDASASQGRTVVVLEPPREVSADIALINQIWPQLHAAGIEGDGREEAAAGARLVRAINTWRPDLLLVGGQSPRSERWMHEQRGALDAGTTLLLPSLHARMAGVAQRAGVPLSNARRVRRQATLRRALATTIGPAAASSAGVMGSWLHGARAGLSDWTAALPGRQPPAALRRLGALRGSQDRPVKVHVAEWHDTEELEVMRRLGAPPLARLAPPNQPRTLAPADRRGELADQPTTALPLDELSARSEQAPPVVTGYIVQTYEAISPPEEPRASTSSAEATPLVTAAGAPPTRVPAPPPTAAQLAPTRRLQRRVPDSEGLPSDALPTRSLRRPASMPPEPPEDTPLSADTGTAEAEGPEPGLSGSLAPATTTPLRGARTTPLPEVEETAPEAATVATGSEHMESLSTTPSSPPAPSRRGSRRYWARVARTES